MSASGLRTGAAKTGFMRRLRGMRGDRGATLVEFALVAVPFFILLFGTIEVGLVHWGTYELENATEDAAREIRTGQVAATNMNGAGFKQLVCRRVSLLAQCQSRLKLDVQSFASFTDMRSAAIAPGLDSEGNLTSDGAWVPGGPQQIVLVTAFYEWPLINPISSISLSNMGSGNRLLRASAAFRNEPFPG